MDRPIVYTQEQGRSTDFLFASRATMIGLGKLAKAMLGANTIIEGLAVAPTAPASLAVQVGSGQIYSFQPVDSTAYGVLPADTADSIVKQGLLMQATTLNTPAPTTSGYSINYLIEAAYQDSDANSVVLPYFNSANPSQPLSGQNNSGVAQPTQRQGLCVVQIKAGASATTGTQTTPTVDAGYTALAVVTVAYGQASVTSSNITPVAGAPIISNLLTMMQTASSITAQDVGSVNAYAMNLQPAISAYTSGMIVSIQNIKATNTGASTLSINGMPSLPIYGPAATAMQGGELAASYGAILRVNSAATAFELVATAGGSLPVKAATQNGQAVNLGQLFIGNRKAVFTANGSWTVPSYISTIWVSGCGAGGGGGGGNNLGSSTAGAGGGGGFPGVSVIKHAIPVTGGHSLSITIGAGGVGGAGTASLANASAGSAGGNTVLFDSTSSTTLLTLAGGAPGSGAITYQTNYVFGGVGSSAGWCAVGTAVSSSSGVVGYGGAGQGGPFGAGGGGGGGVAGGAAGAGAGAGAGGGGGGSPANGNGNGGPGANGFLIIEW
jgi:hypothetical protein